MRISILLYIAFFFFCNSIFSQSEIKVYDQKINKLDKQKRKQGEWLFFDAAGNVVLSCIYKNDVSISPVIFYENTDTVFVKFTKKETVQDFIVFQNKKRYYGAYVYTSDSTYRIELEDANIPPSTVLQIIKKYQDISYSPVYYFAQQKLIDFTSAGFTAMDVSFNKPISVVITLNGSGLVTNVEFPKNYYSDKEERELYWMYSTMPRWQPYFNNNKTESIKIKLGINSSISILKAEHGRAVVPDL